MKLLNNSTMPILERSDDIKTYEVHYPLSDYSFLHEAAIIEYHGILFASWYNNHKTELHGRTPIRGRRSYDGGRSWSEPEVILDDTSGEIIYCPPVYGICDDKLYMLVNEMVGADLIHALDLLLYNEKTDKFEFLWSKPIPFKLNTNVCKLNSGKLLLPGRIAELDGFPVTPAVLISDSGKIDAEWRIVRIQENGDLPDGTQLFHPEVSPIIHGEDIIMFCRNDNGKVPIGYKSSDSGESWTEPYFMDIPFSNSKIYSGTLSDGRDYVIGNLCPNRGKLVLLLTNREDKKFSKGYILQDGFNERLNYGLMWHYPSAYEADGKLYVIYSADIEGSGRGAVLSVLPIDKL